MFSSMYLWPTYISSKRRVTTVIHVNLCVVLFSFTHFLTIICMLDVYNVPYELCKVVSVKISLYVYLAQDVLSIRHRFDMSTICLTSFTCFAHLK